MGAEGATLGETFLADFTFIRLFPCVSSSMLGQVLSRAKRLAAKLADFRLLAGMYPNVDLHVLSPN